MRRHSQCTWKKYIIMQRALGVDLRIRDKRRVFAAMRVADVTHDHFIPSIGVTMGEFSYWQLMSESRRRE